MGVWVATPPVYREVSIKQLCPTSLQPPCLQGFRFLLWDFWGPHSCLLCLTPCPGFRPLSHQVGLSCVPSVPQQYGRKLGLHPEP